MNYELDQERVEKEAKSAADKSIGSLYDEIDGRAEYEAELFVAHNYAQDHPIREELKQTFKLIFVEAIKRLI